ncbi:unnamed protein product [Boreogadus saida]
MFESTGVLKTALWRPTVFLELQSSGTTSRLSPKIGPVIGLSVAVGCQLSGGPENHPGERDHFASESEMSPQIGLNGAVGGPRSGGLPEAPEEGNSPQFHNSQSYPPLEPREDLQTWGHQLHHSVRFGDSSRTQKQSGPAPLDDSQDLQTVGNQPPHSVRLRDLFSDSDATLSRYSGTPGRPLAATTPFLGHRYFRT